MRSIHLATSLSLLAVASAPAYAATTASGYVVAFQSYNSAQAYSCAMIIGSSSSSTSGTTYYIDDSTSDDDDAICTMAMSAMYFNGQVTVTYTSTGGYRYATGLSSSRSSSNIPYLYADDATGTTSADKCYAVMTSSSGAIDAYVDDNSGEEIVTCAQLALLHFYGAASWYVYRTSGEIDYLYSVY